MLTYILSKTFTNVDVMGFKIGWLTWEHRELGEVSEKITQKNKDNLYSVTLTNSAEYGIIDQRSFFDKDISNAKNLSNYYVVHPDDFVYNPRISNEAPVGPIKRNNLDITGVMSPLYYVFRPHDINKTFLEYYFSTSKWHKFMKLNGNSGARSDRFSIKDSEFVKMPIPSPKNEEQVKIGKLLSIVATYLALQQRKLDQLNTLKKGLLQKMFADKKHPQPELRFKGFSGDWEQRKLGEVATFLNGRAYKQDELLDSGKYKVLRVGNFYTNDSWYYSNMELGDKYYVDKGDLIYTWSATFGPHIWSGEKVIYHYHIWKVELSKFLDRNFTLQLLEADKARLLSSTNGSTMIHVTKGDMESKIVSIPNIDEQKQIGSFFKQLDNTITLQQKQIDKLNSLKKSLLQNMFI